MVEHFYVKFGDSSYTGFLGYRAEKETHGQTEVKNIPATAVGIGNKKSYVGL